MFNIKPKTAGKIKSKVGLDIGSDFIKIAEIDSSEKPKLLALGLKEIPDGSKAATVEAIKALAGEAKVSVTEFNISVSGPNVLVRFLTMPKMRDEDLKNAVKFEAEKFIPFNINDCMLDFQVLGKDDKDNKQNVLLVVAKKEQIIEKVKAVEGAGFSAALVDVDSFALANSFWKNFPTADPAKSTAILNIGSSVTNLSIIKGPSIYFARDIAMGSSDFCLAISKKMGITIKSGEELKAVSPDKLADVLNYAKQALGNFMDDIRLCFSYYENQAGSSVDEIYISGGASALVGLNEAFEESFGSKPAIWNPLKFLDVSSAGLDPKLIETKSNLFAVASGLALR